MAAAKEREKTKGDSKARLRPQWVCIVGQSPKLNSEEEKSKGVFYFATKEAEGKGKRTKKTKF